MFSPSQRTAVESVYLGEKGRIWISRGNYVLKSPPCIFVSLDEILKKIFLTYLFGCSTWDLCGSMQDIQMWHVDYLWLIDSLAVVGGIWGFSGDSDDNESACNAGDQGLIPGSRRSSGEGNSYQLHYSCLENSMERSLVDYSPWGCKELGTTEQLALTSLYILQC